ncbi:MAG: hypothetical protein JWN70_6818 [Planctomycetaceae bacterium]|nr:hypothetical protein [Planctomycetaceae bacterium]
MIFNPGLSIRPRVICHFELIRRVGMRVALISSNSAELLVSSFFSQQGVLISMRRWFGFPVVCGLLLSLAVGCGGAPAGPKRVFADVAGKVLYKGAPLKMGTIMFQPSSGAPASGKINPDGTYSLVGEIGPNTITITSVEEVAKIAEPGKSPPIQNHIPVRYGTRDSGLKFEVKAGKNTADFDLKG